MVKGKKVHTSCHKNGRIVLPKKVKNFTLLDNACVVVTKTSATFDR